MARGAFDALTHYPLVRITWEDHWSEDGWEDIDAVVAKPGHNSIVSIGWMVHEDASRYLICNNIAEDKTGCMYMCILKGTVTNFEVLANGRQGTED